MANILLIDDDPELVVEQVRPSFSEPVHRIELARTAAEGLKQTTAGGPDIIVLDLRLPEQSGLGVYQPIRQIDAHILVISSPQPKEQARRLNRIRRRRSSVESMTTACRLEICSDGRFFYHTSHRIAPNDAGIEGFI